MYMTRLEWKLIQIVHKYNVKINHVYDKIMRKHIQIAVVKRCSSKCSSEYGLIKWSDDNSTFNVSTYIHVRVHISAFCLMDRYIYLSVCRCVFVCVCMTCTDINILNNADINAYTHTDRCFITRLYFPINWNWNYNVCFNGSNSRVFHHRIWEQKALTHSDSICTFTHIWEKFQHNWNFHILC